MGNGICIFSDHGIMSRIWLIDEVNHKIHLMGEIKFAFAELS